MPGVHPVQYHETFGKGSGVGRESDGRMHSESIILRFCRLLPLMLQDRHGYRPDPRGAPRTTPGASSGSGSRRRLHV